MPVTMRTWMCDTGTAWDATDPSTRIKARAHFIDGSVISRASPGANVVVNMIVIAHPAMLAASADARPDLT